MQHIYTIYCHFVTGSIESQYVRSVFRINMNMTSIFLKWIIMYNPLPFPITTASVHTAIPHSTTQVHPSWTNKSK